MNTWQPIETAPKDAPLSEEVTWIIVTDGKEVAPARWGHSPYGGGEQWMIYQGDSEWEHSIDKPTHWMPLPEPPEV